MSRYPLLMAAALAIRSLDALAVPVVLNTDFIADSARTAFNGFELAPATFGDRYTGSFPYVEQGIAVSQIDGAPPIGIWLTCGAVRAAGYCFGKTGADGHYSWYPNGGDTGYTKIAKSDQTEFESVGFAIGNAYTSVAATFVSYELFEHGTSVLAGRVFIPFLSSDRGYLGFSGGGFDEIHVSERWLSGDVNVLAIDSIELAVASPVPEPGPAALLLLGSIPILVRAKRVRGRRHHV